MKPLRPLALLILVLTLAGCPKVDSPKLVVFSDPLSAEEHARLGSIHERNGDLDRAFDEYSAALKKDPENLQALTGLGNVATKQGNYRIAIRYYKEALKVDSDNPVVLNNLAMACLYAGKTKDALDYADRAVRIDDGKDPRLLDTRAQARMTAGDRDGAIADLTAALEICDQTFTVPEGETTTVDLNLLAACQEIRGRLTELNNQEKTP